MKLAQQIGGVALAFWALAGMAQEVQPSLNEPVETAVAGGAPGAVALVRGPQGETLAAAGIADKKTQTPMPTDEPLRIASISKMFTAAAVHQLAADGVLDLDKTAAEYVDAGVIAGVPNADAANLRQLLNHTSGVPDYYDLRSYLFWDWRQPIDTGKVLDVARRRKATDAPGEAYAYSNTNYHLLALAAEAASGRPLGDLIEDRIIAPLGLANTRYHDGAHPGGTIHGYGTELRPWADTWVYAENTGPDAGITATPQDLATFFQALFSSDGALRAVGESMLSEVVEGEGRLSAGLGMEVIATRTSGRLIGHTGDTYGYLSFAFYVEDADTVAIGHINANKPQVLQLLLRDVVRAARAGGSE